MYSIENLWMTKIMRTIDPRVLAELLPGQLVNLYSSVLYTSDNAAADRVLDDTNKLVASVPPATEDPVKHVSAFLWETEQFLLDRNLTVPEPHHGWRHFAESLGLDKTEQALFIFAAALNHSMYWPLKSVTRTRKLRSRARDVISTASLGIGQLDKERFGGIEWTPYPWAKWIQFVIGEDFRDVLHAIGFSLTSASKGYYTSTYGTYGTSRLNELVCPCCVSDSIIAVTSNTLIQELDAPLSNMLTPALPDSTIGFLSQCHTRPAKELANYFAKPLTKTGLDKSDFEHIASLDRVSDYLRGVLENKEKGANVLVYGPPGTGKTEFVKFLGKNLKIPMMEAPTNELDRSMKISDRLARVKLTTLMLKYTGSILVVDEAEDIFANTNYANVVKTTESSSKHILNTFLESVPVPVIWIVNGRSGIDPAFIRRCDCMIEVNRLPQKARLKIIRHHTHGLGVEATWKKEVAKNTKITAADVKSTTRVARLAGYTRKKAQVAIEKELTTRLKEREGKAAQSITKNGPDIPYRLSWINADTDMGKVAEYLNVDNSRFCFYGPPGTGKTAFVRYVASQSGRNLLERRASDLLSMWVGQTEKLIAEAFEEAQLDDSILLIDEADSFLLSRDSASRGWEVSRTNELLVQMENFPGTLVCCTNMVEGLDSAAFRRFDLKIEFKPLTHKQAVEMLGEICPVTPDAKLRLQKMTVLTPGDFAAVQRRSKFLKQKPSALEIIKELEKETRHKINGGNNIGF